MRCCAAARCAEVCVDEIDARLARIESLLSRLLDALSEDEPEDLTLCGEPVGRERGEWEML